MICDILIFGGDGDLAYRKLYPAIYHLDLSGCLPDCLKVVGTSRSSMSTLDFQAAVKSRMESLGKVKIDETVWKRFAQRLHYQACDATAENDLAQLRDSHFRDKSRDIIVYLATPPSIFAPICQSMWAVGLARPNTRLVVEKPLGESQETFLEINDSLTSIFNEEQVYRIDHYLGKETVQNLLAMRFANAMFEPLWNSHYIDHVQITVAETVGVEGRWGFYDQAGALRDMVQNHLLQLLCLVAMEPPARLGAREVQEEKLKVLRSLKPMSKADVREHTVRGQYTEGAIGGTTVPGYLQEEGSNAGSNTETFVAIKAEINNWRWSGVPFYLRTGKRMVRRFAEIIIQFNDVPHVIFDEQISSQVPNRLGIRLQPNEGIRLMLLNKVPGLDDPMGLDSVALDLSLSDAFTNRRVPDAYERLLFDVMRGNSTLFMRAAELEAAWCWVDGIIAGWRSTNKKVAGYPAGSWGPSESIALIAKDGRNWFEG